MKFRVNLVGPVLAGAVNILLSRPAALLTPFVALFAAMVATDWLTMQRPEAASLFNLITTVTTLFVVAWVTVITLREVAGVEAAKAWPIGSLFLAGLISGLGTILGLILLILPGLYVAGRWYLASVIVVAEGRSGSDAVSESWTLLDEDWFAAAIVAFIFGVGGIGGAAISILTGTWAPSLAIVGLIGGNLISALFQVTGFAAATIF